MSIDGAAVAVGGLRMASGISFLVDPLRANRLWGSPESPRRHRPAVVAVDGIPRCVDRGIVAGRRCPGQENPRVVFPREREVPPRLRRGRCRRPARWRRSSSSDAAVPADHRSRRRGCRHRCRPVGCHPAAGGAERTDGECAQGSDVVTARGTRTRPVTLLVGPVFVRIAFSGEGVDQVGVQPMLGEHVPPPDLVECV